MSILIVDDSSDNRVLTEAFLKDAGYGEIASCGSAADALLILGLSGEVSPNRDVELILMDIMMPEMDGIELTTIIKSNEFFKDIPVIMLTAKDTARDLQLAFAAGAMDYIKKPFDKDELRARVRSALRLKHETDRRKSREKELLETMKQLAAANSMLQTLSAVDSLTNIANRRFLDYYIDKEWRRAIRSGTHFAVIMADIDHFKLYNDTYGHQMGDDVIRKVAEIFKGAVHRPADLAARYGGEEFVVVLPETGKEGAVLLAEKLCQNVFSLRITHDKSSFGFVSLSFGIADVIPAIGSSPAMLISKADAALYKAKGKGRNRVEYYDGTDR